MKLTGMLAIMALPDLLQWLHTSQKTGTLAIRGDRFTKRIFFRKGDIISSASEYLADKGFVPPNGRPWVDHIRQKGNEANHEIKRMAAADATDLITFAEMLLKFIYEFPNKIPTPLAAPDA